MSSGTTQGSRPVHGTLTIDEITGTVTITAVSLPLGAGAATEATLASLLTELQQKVEAVGALTVASGQVTTLGNNTLITPTSGKKLRLYHVLYNPLLAVEAAFRFGAAGTLFLRTNVLANSVIGKDYGDFKYMQGATDEALILNLSLGVATNWNVMYVEVD